MKFKVKNMKNPRLGEDGRVGILLEEQDASKEMLYATMIWYPDSRRWLELSSVEKRAWIAQKIDEVIVNLDSKRKKQDETILREAELTIALANEKDYEVSTTVDEAKTRRGEA